MPKLKKSQTYDKEKTIALVRKLENPEIVDDFVNYENQKLGEANPEGSEKDMRLVGDYYYCPLPKNVKNEHFITYCCGKKGIGKTTTLCNWINNYRVLTEEKNPVYLISSKDKDATITKELGEDPPIIRIPMDLFTEPDLEEGEEPEENELGLSQPPVISDFENCLICFDDFSYDKKSKAVMALLDSILERGRQPNISVFMIFHKPTDGLKTRLALTEADYFLFNPDSLSPHNFKYFAENYAGISDKKLKKDIKKIDRFITVSNTPSYVVTPQRVLLPSHVQDE